MKFGYKKQVPLSFVAAVEKAKKELANEGFGIITEINAKETFKKKLEVDFENYIILGACQPASAYKVLQIDKELGLLLPCNVIIYEEDKKVYISAILPKTIMNGAGNEALDKIAQEIELKLRKVVDKIYN
jgi:uncharacterized protein (DUF302 family)